MSDVAGFDRATLVTQLFIMSVVLSTSALGLGAVPWAVILAMTVMFSTMLTLDASITSEQRIALFLQSGFFP
jgi:hypothetical protein